MAEIIKLNERIVDLHYHKSTNTMYISIPSLISLLSNDGVKFLSSESSESKTVGRYIAKLIERLQETTEIKR